jgi:hypothetical protein
MIFTIAKNDIIKDQYGVMICGTMRLSTKVSAIVNATIQNKETKNLVC